MNTKQIEEALGRIFQEEDARIVFWNDPEREFDNDVAFLNLDDVNLMRLDQIGALEAKCILEKGDPVGKYLLYAPVEEPEFDKDWLLDIRLYSRSFRADRASIILDELGLTQQRMREHLASRRKFFDAKERQEKLKTLVSPVDDELALDLKMIAVICKAEQPELFIILRTLLHQLVQSGGDLESLPEAWEQIEKFELDESFWKMVKGSFGYSEDNPSLRKLLIQMMLSEFMHDLGPKHELPAFKQLCLPKPGNGNAIVCLAQWRDSSSTASSYDILAEQVAREFRIDDVVEDLELEALQESVTFLEVERSIIRGLRDRVHATTDAIDPAPVRDLVRRRQAKHWASRTAVGSATVPRAAIHDAYAALEAAAELLALRNEYRHELPYADADDLYHLYVDKLYRFDQLYRHFCERAGAAQREGWGLLKLLREDIERVYCNSYLLKLATEWNKCIAAGLIKSWKIEGVPRQKDFFKEHVRPQIESSDRSRVFVIISDAFRYEAAQELTGLLNGEYRIQAQLTTQLGVLPSYTALGMASLLPGTTLTYGAAGDITVDGKPTAGLDGRNAILAGVKGIAVRGHELVSMKKEEGRSLVANSRVIYIYHDVIDKTGENDEEHTFDAVRTAINELMSLLKYVLNNLNGNHIIITADHGFLFTETPPKETDKSKLAEKPTGAVVAKKRYIIGRGLGDCDDAWCGATRDTAGATGDMEFWVPKGVNRFHLVGGARFIHGGAMPQEIVVPVITIKHMKDKAPREKTKSKPVQVSVLSPNVRITTQRHRFRLLQLEAVSDRIKAVTLKIAIYEGDEPVTDIETVTFDSNSEKLDDRQKDVYLVLRDRQYSKKTPYRLVLRDIDTGAEQNISVTIDRAISDDF